MPRVHQVTIVGMGLIGGSLGMAIKRRHLATTVVGLSRSPSTIRRAIQRGAIDTGTTDARRAVAAADLVIVATPVDCIVPQALRLARWMRPGSLLTDVGSTKAHIVMTLERRLPRHVTFVGGHPLAGSEQRGIAAATPRLFDGSLCIVTRTARINRASLQRVTAFWKQVARRVIVMSPRQHDRILAATSHVPHLLAFSLVAASSPMRLPWAPPSFVEMTRVAKSDPDLWDDIFLTNREALLVMMDRFEQHWRVLRTLIARRDHTTLRRVLRRAHSLRYALHDH